MRSETFAFFTLCSRVQIQIRVRIDCVKQRVSLWRGAAQLNRNSTPSAARISCPLERLDERVNEWTSAVRHISIRTRAASAVFSTPTRRRRVCATGRPERRRRALERREHCARRLRCQLNMCPQSRRRARGRHSIAIYKLRTTAITRRRRRRRRPVCELCVLLSRSEEHTSELQSQR